MRHHISFIGRHCKSISISFVTVFCTAFVCICCDVVCFICTTRRVAWYISFFLRMQQKPMETKYKCFIRSFSFVVVFVVSHFFWSKAFFIWSCCDCLSYFCFAFCFSSLYETKSFGGRFVDSEYNLVCVFFFSEFLYFTSKLKKSIEKKE